MTFAGRIHQGGDHLRAIASAGAVLLYAAGLGHTEVVDLLLARGESQRAAYKNDLTALMWAAAYGHARTVKLLLERGADVNARDNRGKTALAMAVEGGHRDTEQLLRKAGAAEPTPGSRVSGGDSAR